MANAKNEEPKGGKQEEKSSPDAEGAEGKAAAAKGGKGGAIKAFLPLIIAAVVMPALSFVTTNYILLPKVRAAMGQGAGYGSTNDTATASASADKADSKEGSKDGKGAAGKAKITIPMDKVLVNVAGTMGTRYLMTSLTLVSSNPDFKMKYDDNKDHLQELAANVLSTKTIADLDKPGSRNVIRSELMTDFNNALGAPIVTDIYIKEMAIQ
jgi:flagellar FliL protein